ncbi:GPI transamidase component PIG-T [Anopheles maculipalpis]|uniref:GPI transamidase component PIG-T n=1 Tax=Anopheles maculipalpis TaxID=1496333 RepID=UPI002158C685|nr:GPI transamidase component PIG-T [Anopheles maculipalpis]
MWKFTLWNVLAIAFGIGVSAEFSDIFDEELFIKPLPDKFVYSYFQFTTRWELGKNDSLLHTNLVPRPLAELFYHFGVQELHLSFTYGLWRYESWGYPVTDAGPGAEVWAWFEPTTDRASVDHRWKMLCGTLSGLFCASLSFIDPSNTYEPVYTLRPQTHHFPGQAEPILRYAALPREIVCTENLTPWAKLLPCRSREGLVSLLVPDSIYSSNYHSLGVHMRKLCANAECSEFQLEVKQTVSVVQDLRLFGGPNWSIRKLFGQGMEGSCALATTSNVYVDVTDSNGAIDVSQKADETILSIRGGARTELQRFDVKQFEAIMAKGRRAMFNVAVMDKRDPNVIIVAGPPPIFAKRFILGVGQERGKIVTHITNAHWGALDLIVFENIPWFVPIYLHTLTIRQGSERIQPAFLHYTPGVQRERPYGLEVAFRIPARSTVELSIDFDYIFLKWQEYPPDANHGHYIPSSIISLLLPSARNYTSIPREAALFRDSFNATQLAGYFLQVRTESLLLTLPTPDFSMPYNVICLACTVVALAFGPIHNISTKRIVAKGKETSKTSLGKKVKQFFKIKSGRTAKQAKDEQTASTEDLNAPDTE